MAEKAILIVDDRRHELPILTGTEGERALDVSKLREQTGLIAYDPSLGNTALCRSEITFTNGEEGILRYRGIPIEQFANKPDFVETAWLLIFGRLPRREELAKFSGLMTANELLHEGVRHQFQHAPPDSPPMALLSATLNNLTCYHQEFFSLGDEESLEEAAARLISKIRTIAAFSYRRSLGMPFIYPDPNLRYCANFLHMMFSIPYRQYHASQEVEDALNLIFILHADHELNCSTSTVRIVGSAGVNLFASCAAGVCALWGSLHGGANVEVMEMLERISSGGLSPEECIHAAKDKTNPFRLYGFGHRVYRRYDPRAKILKAACEKVFAGIKRKDPLLDIARKLEELALADPYFIDRNLYPNMDFYSGMLLRSIGIPTNMFTVCFAIGRLPGWIAHWKEQHDDPNTKIQRPRQIYTGPNELTYVPMKKR